MMEQADPSLSTAQVTIASRAANEGVPIAAIARIVQQPFDLVVDVLKSALSMGHIGEMPRADWPPGTKWTARLPVTVRSANSEDVEFGCRKAFKLTGLEAAFLVTILRYDLADKERLHNVVEHQRHSRATRPDTNEMTDPKMVDVIICKLRKKLKAIDDTLLVKTSWGSGYYLDPAVKEAIYERIGGHFALEPVE